jgi:hypothetical protein
MDNLGFTLYKNSDVSTQFSCNQLHLGIITISDLGYADFSEWFIGHSGSTYWTKKDSEKAEIFASNRSYNKHAQISNVHFAN